MSGYGKSDTDKAIIDMRKKIQLWYIREYEEIRHLNIYM